MEKVVHVTTSEQWKSVLDVWFKQGYAWPGGDQEYSVNIFLNGGRFLFLDDFITYSFSNSDSKPFIEYKEFMEEQKEDNKMETYYVTQGKLNVIEKLKSMSFPLYQLLNEDEFHSLSRSLDDNTEKALLRYIGGDETVEFKVKEILYRLQRVDLANDIVYMKVDNSGNPSWTYNQDNAFKAPLEEIKKWQTPAWEIEEAI